MEMAASNLYRLILLADFISAAKYNTGCTKFWIVSISATKIKEYVAVGLLTSKQKSYSFVV